MDFNSIAVKIEKGYPDWQVSPNPKIAGLLTQSYASRQSETTSVMTYLYQSLVIAPFDEDIARLFEKIAYVEMEHHNLLGKLIVSYGGNPMLAFGNRFWSGGSVLYTRNLKEILISNITAEETAILDYKILLKKIPDESVKAVIECIIEEEELHIKAFKEILEYVTFWK